MPTATPLPGQQLPARENGLFKKVVVRHFRSLTPPNFGCVIAFHFSSVSTNRNSIEKGSRLREKFSKDFQIMAVGRRRAA